MDLISLARFAKAFRESGAQRRFHISVPAYEDKDGYTVFARDSLGVLGIEFIETLQANGWVLGSPFSPVHWIHSEEANLLLNDRSALAAASAEQLAKLLTFVLRQERWANGALASAFDSGLLLAIAERAEVLVKASEGSRS